MSDFPFLTLMVVVPLVGAVATAALPAGHKLELPKLVALGVDGLGLLMVLLTALLVPIVIGASWYDADPGVTLRVDDEASATRHTKAFFAWTLALEALSIAVFAATDVFL